MATTQQQIDLRDARKAAAEAGLECEIESTGDDYTITMDTGEIETVTGLPGALRVIQEYAARLPKVTVAGQRVPYEAAVNLMDDDLREELNSSWTGAEDDCQGFMDAYAAAHAERFGEEFQVA